LSIQQCVTRQSITHHRGAECLSLGSPCSALVVAWVRVECGAGPQRCFTRRREDRERVRAGSSACLRKKSTYVD
jgi:hypothetical protein